MSDRPALSLILCSRNDRYMGNPVWRLQTAVNYVAERAARIKREKDLEIVIADWGSEVPLREVVKLTPGACRMTKFVHVPGPLAQTLQLDSPFPEVLALNAAARRAQGVYIGRIDQDTLVGETFLKTFLAIADGSRSCGVPCERGLWFANRRSIPYRLAVRCPAFWLVERFLRYFGPMLHVEHPRFGDPIWRSDVGIWLAHRDIWWRCGGYDERLIYMTAMEPNMVSRLLLHQYTLVDVGKMTGYDFYHLDHYHPWRPRNSSTRRKVNRAAVDIRVLNPNGDAWGLVQHPIGCTASAAAEGRARVATGMQLSWASQAVLFALFVARIAPEVGVDSLFYGARRMSGYCAVWARRARAAAAAVSGQPMGLWPGILVRLWGERRYHAAAEAEGG